MPIDIQKPIDLVDFQNASFVPFEYYVNRAKHRNRLLQARADFLRKYGDRRTDFTDAVDVSVISIDQAPEFADTVPDFQPTEPMELPEVTHAQVDIVVTDDVIDSADVIATKIARAQNFVASRAFAECLHAGYFPPRCQSCGL